MLNYDAFPRHFLNVGANSLSHLNSQGRKGSITRSMPHRAPKTQSSQRVLAGEALDLAGDAVLLRDPAGTLHSQQAAAPQQVGGTLPLDGALP